MAAATAERIYLAMGLTSTTLPEAIIDAYIALYEVQYPSDDCKVLYYTIIACYNYLIAQSAATASGGGKRREKNSRREIEINAYDKSVDWKAALDNFLKNPWVFLPECTDTLTSGIRGKIIMTGVRKDAVIANRQNTNRYSQYQERSPYSPRRGGCAGSTEDLYTIDDDC